MLGIQGEFVKKSILVLICFLFSFTSNANDQFTSLDVGTQTSRFFVVKCKKCLFLIIRGDRHHDHNTQSSEAYPSEII